MAGYNDDVIKEFRDNHGKVGEMFSGMELLLLHSIGAKSGKDHITPVAYTMDGTNYIIVASKAGAPTNPDWYFNLVAHPEAEVEVGDDKLKVKARVAEDGDRERLFDQHAAKYPGFNDYKAKTSRVIPVFILTKV
jgi:deazaflavin-dependent oxidoreductase (nitroreductase family)